MWGCLVSREKPTYGLLCRGDARCSLLLFGDRVALTSTSACVFCLRSSVEGFGLEAEARMTTWHVMIPSENESDSTHSHDVSEGEGVRMCEE